MTEMRRPFPDYFFKEKFKKNTDMAEANQAVSVDATSSPENVCANEVEFEKFIIWVK